MKFGRSRLGTGHDAKSWPVLLPLLVVVLVPTVGVLWFMSQAMRNERLAVRQELSDAYQAQLLGIQQELQQYWQTRSTELEVQDPDRPGSRIFAERVRDGLADGIVVYDTSGRPAYPAPPLPPDVDPDVSTSNWRGAQRQERSGKYEVAATRYATIAAEATDRNLAAQALQAQARCLVQARRTPDAITILTDELSRPEYEVAVDTQGRLIAPSAQLRALQLLADGGETANPTFRRIAEALGRRLIDYDDAALPAAQRRFLMKQLIELNPDTPVFDTLAAERLAARYVESDPPAAPMTSLQPSGLPGVWHLASPGGSVVALFNQERLVRDLESLIAGQRLPENAAVALLSPGVEPDDLFVVSVPAGGFLQDWQLVLRPEDQALFATAANQRNTAYMLTGSLVVLAIFVLTILVARTVQRQLRLTRLKNDLLGTVSHELKTPLASMRLLVDTLLDADVQDPQRVREYLELIAKENSRLSRLVDNFLTFSRMERNRQTFEKKQIPAETVVAAAVDSVAERFHSTGCRFDIQTSPDLPDIVADEDALVTVLLNLLDNAYKYSKEDKHIVLRSYRENGHVCFAVKDNGIGMSERAAGKIFERFYQVDQSLSRPGSGCGLGLSIVKFIVNAHGGSVAVESRPDEGSTFTVRLPVELDEQEQPEGAILDAR